MINSTLIAHWKGDNTTISDVDNSGGFNLDSTNQLSYSTGKNGLAFQFTQGTEYARKTISNGDLPTTQLSLGFWINTASTDGEIFQFDATPGYSISFASGQYSIKIGSATPKTFQKVPNPQSSWNHISFTWESNGGLLEFYQNGALEGQTTTAAGTTLSTQGIFNVGKYADVAFVGSIDDIVLFNKVITRNDVLKQIGTFCNYIEHSNPSVCSGTGKCVSHNQCSCYSGYFGNNCQDAASTTNCTWNTVSKLQTDYFPVIDSSKTSYNNDTLTVTIETPLVKDRYNTKIFVQDGKENSLCSYPGQYWTPSLKETAGCKNIYTFSIPWIIGKNCGWRKSTVGDEIIYAGNIYVHEKEKVATFRGTPITRTIKSVVRLLIKFKYRITLQTEVTVVSPVYLIAALTKQEFVPGDPTTNTPNSGLLELVTSVGNPYSLKNCTFIETPLPITGTVSKNTVKTQPCINGQACLQWWDMPLTVNSACTFTGTYRLKCYINCQEKLNENEIPTTTVPVVSNNGQAQVDQGSENLIIPINTILTDSYIPGFNSWPVQLTNVSCPGTGYCTSIDTPEIVGENVVVKINDKTTCQATKFRFTVNIKDRLSQTQSGDFWIKYRNCQCNDPIDLCFVYDGSGSISTSDWNSLKNFGSQLLNKLTINENNVHAAIVQFSKYVRTEIGLSSNATDVKNALSSMSQYRSATNTKAGVNRCKTILDGSSRTNVDKVVVVLTDGVANYPCGSDCTWNPNNNQFCDDCVSPLPLTNQINAIKKSNGDPANWKVIALGIGNGLNQYNGYGQRMVQQMNYGNVSHQVSWNDINSVAGIITDESCNTQAGGSSTSSLLNTVGMNNIQKSTTPNNEIQAVDLFGTKAIKDYVDGCPYVNEEGEAIITIKINSENFCEEVTLDIKLTGNMKSYQDTTYSVEKKTYFSNTFAYFKTVVESTQATISKSTVIRTELFDGNRTRVLLDNALNGITDFGKNLSYTIDTAITAGTETGFSFKFQDPFISVPVDASVDFKVTAIVEVEYYAIQQNALNQYPLSVFDLKKKIMKYHFTKRDINDMLKNSQQEDPDEQNGKYDTAVKFISKESSNLKATLSYLLIFAIVLLTF